MNNPARILISEHQSADARLAQDEIKKVLPTANFQVVDSKNQFTKALDEFKPDLVVSNYAMPSFDGLTALRITLEKAPLTPFIFFTSSINEAAAVACMKAGAIDYVLKDELEGLGPAVLEALEHMRNSMEKLEANQAHSAIEENIRKRLEIAKDTRDITQRKLSEEALNESEHFAKAIANTTPAMLYIYDLEEGKNIWVNEAHRKFFSEIGKDLSNLSSLDISALVPPDDFSRLIEKTAEYVSDPKDGCMQEEIRLKWKGDWKWMQIMLTTFKTDTAGKPVQLLGSMFDIDDRKKTEMQLRTSDEQYRKLVSTIPDLIVTSDADGHIDFVNEHALGSFTDLPMDHFIGKKIFSFIHKDDQQRAIDNTRLMFERKLGPQEYRFQIGSADIMECEVNGDLILADDGMPTGAVFVIRDITKVNEAARALRESEQKYRVLVTQMQQGLALHEIITDENSIAINYRFLEVNPGFEKLTGLKREDIIGRTVMEVLPQIEPFWIETYGKVVATGEHASFENYSNELNRYFNVVAFRQTEGQFAVVFEDITERKVAEKDLMEKLNELQRWHIATLGREGRIIELKKEVNDLLVKADQALRYPAVANIEKFGSDHETSNQSWNQW
jgi:PAS domain S-box-containing protein